MPKRQSRHSAVVGLNVGLQHQVVVLKERVTFLETQLSTWSKAKDDAVRAFTDKAIADLNTVTRSISQPRKATKIVPAETGADLGKRYISALTVLHADGLEAAREYFDNPPKDKK